jgi:hypothetical protein
MSDLADIETLVRYQLGDYSKSMIPGDIFTYSTSSVFTLSESNAISVTTVLRNDVELGSGDWSYDVATNKVTVSASLTSGDIIEIQYTYYPNYSSNEILNRGIRSAILALSINNYYTYEIGSDSNLYPALESSEKNLVAFLAAILLEPNNESYRLPDMSISVPKSLPTNDLVRKAIACFKRNTHGRFDLL